MPALPQPVSRAIRLVRPPASIRRTPTHQPGWFEVDRTCAAISSVPAISSAAVVAGRSVLALPISAFGWFAPAPIPSVGARERS